MLTYLHIRNHLLDRTLCLQSQFAWVLPVGQPHVVLRGGGKERKDGGMKRNKRAKKCKKRSEACGVRPGEWHTTVVLGSRWKARSEKQEMKWSPPLCCCISEEIDWSSTLPFHSAITGAAPDERRPRLVTDWWSAAATHANTLYMHACTNTHVGTLTYTDTQTHARGCVSLFHTHTHTHREEGKGLQHHVALCRLCDP